jgi:cyclase
MIFISRTLIAAALVLTPFSVSAQQVFDAVEIRADEIAPGIAVLFGAGGNMAVSYGEDATILVDDQFAELSEKIIGAIAKLGASPVEFVVNTHWHYDHTGGNAAFGRADATLIAHHNVRSRLRSGGRTASRVLEPASAEALPIITFEQGITLHQNGDTIDIIFTGGGHTDGDAVLLWREDNVIHTGDLYSNTGSLPFTDLDAGGNIRRSMNSLA